MAARRLIVAVLVLLGISTGLAIVAPDPTEQTVETGTTGSTSPTSGDGAGPTGGTGETGQTGESGPTGEKGATGGGSPPGAVQIAFTASGKQTTLCVRPGSRVILTVRTAALLDVSVPDFGRTASATAFAPAVFDLLMPEKPGRYDIEALATDRSLATIVSNENCGRPDGAGST